MITYNSISGSLSIIRPINTSLKNTLTACPNMYYETVALQKVFFCYHIQVLLQNNIIETFETIYTRCPRLFI